MKHFLFLFLFCVSGPIAAQQLSRLNIGAEYGIAPLTGKIDDRWEFRESGNWHSSHGDYYDNERGMGMGYLQYIGIKTELSLPHKRLRIISGLRYTDVKEKLEPDGGRSYLYLHYPSEQAIEYFRINGIKEKLGYLSIPVEMEFLLWGYDSKWQGYLKGGIQAGLNIYKKTSIEFEAKEMNKHEDEIVSNMGNPPSSFFANTYAAFGVRFILPDGVNFSIENSTPYLFLSKNNFTLLSPHTYPSFQIKLSVPVNTKSSY